MGSAGLFGRVGVAASICGAAFAILTNWEFVTGWEVLLKGRFAFLIVAVTLSHVSLLLLLNTANVFVRILRWLTIAWIAAIASSFLVITLISPTLLIYWPILASLGVLCVLGTLATPLAHLATRESRQAVS